MEAFELLIKRLSPKLKGIAYKAHWTGQFFNHEDLYQEALVHLWRDYNAGILSDKTDSYILQGCYFYLKNYVRGAFDKTRAVSLDEPASSDGESRMDSLCASGNESARDFIDQLDSKMTAEAIRNNGLTDKEKLLLPLFSEGLTTRQIGSRIGMTHVGVIKMRRVIAGKCRKHLDKE